MTTSYPSHDAQEQAEAHAPYIQVWVALLVLTLAEYFWAKFLAGSTGLLIGGLLSMALVKAGLVGYYFMHVKFTSPSARPSSWRWWWCWAWSLIVHSTSVPRTTPSLLRPWPTQWPNPSPPPDQFSRVPLTSRLSSKVPKGIVYHVFRY